NIRKWIGRDRSTHISCLVRDTAHGAARSHRGARHAAHETGPWSADPGADLGISNLLIAAASATPESIRHPSGSRIPQQIHLSVRIARSPPASLDRSRLRSAMDRPASDAYLSLPPPDMKTFRYASDQSLMVQLSESIDLDTHHRVLKLLRLLEAEKIPGVRNLHPAYNSILIVFDPAEQDHKNIQATVATYLDRLDTMPLPA